MTGKMAATWSPWLRVTVSDVTYSTSPEPEMSCCAEMEFALRLHLRVRVGEEGAEVLSNVM